MQNVKNVMDFKAKIATLARHEGVWDGTYHQTNHYAWADGRTEVHNFPALIRDDWAA